MCVCTCVFFFSFDGWFLSTPAAADVRAGVLGEPVDGDEHRGLRLRDQEWLHVRGGEAVEQGTARRFVDILFLRSVFFYVGEILITCCLILLTSLR